MDAFETVIASILQRQGYWTLTSVKVELTKAEKRPNGISSSVMLVCAGWCFEGFSVSSWQAASAQSARA